jgi:hypothetical protein
MKARNSAVCRCLCNKLASLVKAAQTNCRQQDVLAASGRTRSQALSPVFIGLSSQKVLKRRMKFVGNALLQERSAALQFAGDTINAEMPSGIAQRPLKRRKHSGSRRPVPVHLSSHLAFESDAVS